ncbi:hypothetical protein SKAU_G00210400 [Synaphobranchus kaupii]|uniref:Uncharacterized protein n=1 Tax=Synaphobranchus kaupii TaxID=118154 RepID=A0A9Q1F983_SYNKA|nr:hypothetical protein SKAU_G00210400 [Synaphobranchus kaupii]
MSKVRLRKVMIDNPRTRRGQNPTYNRVRIGKCGTGMNSLGLVGFLLYLNWLAALLLTGAPTVSSQEMAVGGGLDLSSLNWTELMEELKEELGVGDLVTLELGDISPANGDSRPRDETDRLVTLRDEIDTDDSD